MTDSYLDSMQMQSGTYVIRDTDLPLKYLYQCDPEDKTKVCLRELAKGESTGRSDR